MNHFQPERKCHPILSFFIETICLLAILQFKIKKLCVHRSRNYILYALNHSLQNGTKFCVTLFLINPLESAKMCASIESPEVLRLDSARVAAASACARSASRTAALHSVARHPQRSMPAPCRGRNARHRIGEAWQALRARSRQDGKAADGGGERITYGTIYVLRYSAMFLLQYPKKYLIIRYLFALPLAHKVAHVELHLVTAPEMEREEKWEMYASEIFMFLYAFALRALPK